LNTEKQPQKLRNIVILGFAFMLVFTAFQTCENIEQTVIKSFNSSEFHGSGYTSMSIIYGVFSVSNLVAPSVVAVIGPQFSMFLGGLLYSAYIAMFIHPYTWSFYTASVLVGVGAAVLWTAQGNVLAINSDNHTIGRNSGIFWALLQFSLFFGNLYIYCAWHGHEHITGLNVSIISLCVLVCVFILYVCVSQIRTDRRFSSHSPSSASSVTSGPADTSFMLCCLLTNLTFYSGVYGTCIGAMNRFGKDAKSLIGISGICVGIGEILGGGIFGFLNKSSRFRRNPVVLVGLVTHIVAFYLVFLNIASDAPLAPEAGTDQEAFISPSVSVALLCSFLLGFGDSCYNTQLLSVVGFLFRDNSAPAFAVYKFIQSIMAALAFFYSNFLLLHWQLLILVLSGFLGTFSFFLAEWKVQSHLELDYSSI
uniref:UNC93-like protein MFSD11 n=1 Tax=Gouania willdenowi TaxID=441366 RepID=A0A8C5GGZ5_GOUWI